MAKQSDYCAELYVAGKLADAGWNVYFPHRDRGFDFIISKRVGDSVVIRPVQVKGKFPTDAKTNKTTYGHVGRLSEVHPGMVLAIAFFDAGYSEPVPSHIAFMPYAQLRRHKRGWRCQPAAFKNSKSMPRREYKRFFDNEGIGLLESSE